MIKKLNFREKIVLAFTLLCGFLLLFGFVDYAGAATQSTATSHASIEFYGTPHNSGNNGGSGNGSGNGEGGYGNGSNGGYGSGGNRTLPQTGAIDSTNLTLLGAVLLMTTAASVIYFKQKAASME